MSTTTPASTAAVGGSRELDLSVLGTYLSGVLPVAPVGPLAADLIAGGRSNPTYVLSDGSTEWILRRPPHGHVLQSAHDMGREARVITALAATSVPVPVVLAHCRDLDVMGAEFYVMEKLEGRTYRTHADTAGLTVAQRAGLSDSLVDTLVRLHEVEPEQVGLGDWGRPQGYLQRQLSRWGRQWQSVKTAERPEVDELLRRLGASLPETRFTGVVHGDYKIDNVMVSNDDPTRIVGLLDWEMSTLGDTLSDLGLLVSFWDEVGAFHNPITAGATAHAGFPTGEQVVQAYAERRGVDLGGIDWYIVFADLKIAVVLEQIHARHLEGATTGDWFDDIGAMVEPLLSRALERSTLANDPALRGVG